jgi:hypothetical protein
MPLPTDYVDGDVLSASDVNACVHHRLRLLSDCFKPHIHDGGGCER